MYKLNVNNQEKVRIRVENALTLAQVANSSCCQIASKKMSSAAEGSTLLEVGRRTHKITRVVEELKRRQQYWRC